MLRSLVLVCLARTAGADPCVDGARLEDFAVDGTATLVAGASCGTFIAATDAAATSFSYGRFTYRKDVAIPYELSITWRRLDGAGRRSLEINIPGGAVMIRDGHWGVYTTEAAFEKHGWMPLPGLRISKLHTVLVRQTATGIEVSIDGKVAGIAPPPAAVTGREISLALKGPRAVRSKMLFTGFAVRSLTGARP